MLRRRTALSFTAAALLAATPLLTSCGKPHAGAAAVIGGEQISVSTLQAKVNEVRAAQKKTPQAAQLIDASSQLTGSTLNSMVFDRVLDKAASDAGVSVSRAEIQQVRTNLEQQAGGAANMETRMLQTYATAPGDIDAFCRTQVELQKLSQSAGADLNTAAGKTTVTKLLVKASDELGVDVNPRFGTWDAGKLSLAATQDPWLAKAPQAGLPG